jgi:Na+/H+ antiporter NhaC
MSAGFAAATRSEIMSSKSRKSMAWTVVLILLGVAALFGGAKWLSLLIPAAMFVWFAAKPSLRTGRN